MLRTRINMIIKVISRYWKCTHKCGIIIPKTYKHAMQLYEQNCTDLWRIAWENDMRNVKVSSSIKYEGKVVPVGYQENGCNPILDIKSTPLTRKVRFVGGRYMMDNLLL